MQHHGPKTPLLSASVYTKQGLSYTEKLPLAKDLNVVIAEIQATLKRMNQTPTVVIQGKAYPSLRHAFQEKYTNSTDFIAQLFSRPTRETAPFLPADYSFDGNPLLSFSLDDIAHPGKYSCGLKNYGAKNQLLPEYDNEGQPKNKVLGGIYGVLLTDTLAKKAQPYNVVAHHNKKIIKVSTHFRNNILSEKEVSLAGAVPGKFVTCFIPFEVPNFKYPYNADDKTNYGLTKRRFENIRGILTDPQTPQENKDKKVHDMLQKMIQGTPTDDGAHEQTLTYKFKADFFSNLFEDQGLSYCKGTLVTNDTGVVHVIRPRDA